MNNCDLFVIGAGSGGTRAARIASGYGAKVMVAEEFRIGGTCVIRGCVPKKLLVYASRFADAFEDAKGFGWTVGTASLDWPTLASRVEHEVARLSGLYVQTLEKTGVSIVRERAVVSGAHEVTLASGKTIKADKILIATGGAPELEPKIPGIELAITSNEIFSLPKFPARLLIIGSGYIAVEFASIFARLGAEVTLSFRADKVLRGFDADMRDSVHDALSHAGVVVASQNLPVTIEKSGTGFAVTMQDGAVLSVDHVLCATGRRPNTQNLGLEAVGVALNKKGAVVVDDFSQTSVLSIYAVGDVTDRINLTPVAIREGHAFADTVFGNKPVKVNHALVPSAVFTTPEVGTLGLTEEAAREQYDIVDLYRTSFRPMLATLSGREERVMMKLLVDGKTDKVLGVHIFGNDAGEMAQLLGIALKMGATKADFDATMAVHPTASEELVTMRTRTARFERGTS